MLKRLTLLASSVLLGVITLELLARLAGVAPDLPLEYSNFVPHPRVAYLPRPGTVVSGRGGSDEFDLHLRFNSMGFRDEEHAIVKPEGVFRILGLGDSFTAGYGADYESTYLRRLEVMLNARPGEHPRVEIIKAGVAAFGAAQERLLLEHEGARLSPDLVTVGFLPNDVINAHLGIGYLRPSPEGYLVTETSEILGSFTRWLYLHSHAGRAFLRRFVIARDPYGQIRWPDVYVDDGFHEEDWREVEAELLRMRDLVRRLGAPLVLIHIPQSNLEPYPGERLKAFAAANDIVFLDTQPALVEEAKRAELYWPRDGHCKPECYRVIAEALFERLVEGGLVP